MSMGKYVGAWGEVRRDVGDVKKCGERCGKVGVGFLFVVWWESVLGSRGCGGRCGKVCWGLGKCEDRCREKC